ncbi:Hypothetical predicted protein, partial [Pelobates cultripes]
VHKSKKNPPEKSIASEIDSLTSKLSEFIDFLQKHAESAQSYLKDTKHLLQELDSIEWKDDYIWTSFDVTSLYIVIAHELGTEAIKKSLERNTQSDQALVECIGFILT